MVGIAWLRFEDSDSVSDLISIMSLPRWITRSAVLSGVELAGWFLASCLAILSFNVGFYACSEFRLFCMAYWLFVSITVRVKAGNDVFLKVLLKWLTD